MRKRMRASTHMNARTLHKEAEGGRRSGVCGGAHLVSEQQQPIPAQASKQASRYLLLRDRTGRYQQLMLEQKAPTSIRPSTPTSAVFRPHFYCALPFVFAKSNNVRWLFRTVVLTTRLWC